MEIRIQVKDQWAGLLVTFLRSLNYVEQVEEQQPANAALTLIPEPSEGIWDEVTGIWADRSDEEIARIRPEAWGRTMDQ